MSADDRQPIIVGVADFKNASKELHQDGSDQPAALMQEAGLEAIRDTGVRDEKALLEQIDSISCVRPWSWHYDDLPGELAKRLGLRPDAIRHTFTSPHNGSSPAKLLDEACQRIGNGTSRAALLVGGDALDSLERYMGAGQFPPPGWTPVEFDVMTENMPKAFLDETHGVGQPIQIYAMYENGFRASKRQTFAQNYDDSASMYAEFSKIASLHPASWNTGRTDSKETIARVTSKNRMINTPYPMLMCAFNKVNVAAGCVVTSAAVAKQLGIPSSKWIYVRGGAGTAESEQFYFRTSFSESPAIRQSIDAALRVADVPLSSIDLFDFYSCFPIVPKLARDHLQLPPSAQLTLLGGLTSFGGAGNNYSMHAIAEMTRQLRHRRPSQKQNNGLILANGGVLSYQHVVVLSTEPRTSTYPSAHALPAYCEQLSEETFERIATADEAVVETYTVDYGRKGEAKKGQVIGRSRKTGKRFVANHADETTLRQLADMQNGEVVGRSGRVFQRAEEPERNLFTFVSEEKL